MKQDIRVTTIDKDGQRSETIFEMEMGPEILEYQQAAKAFWDRQEKESNGCKHDGDVKYYDDYEHPECSKHCYVCVKCNTIIQIG